VFRFRIPEETKRKIRKLYAQGLTQKTLSERFGLSAGRISQIISEAA